MMKDEKFSRYMAIRMDRNFKAGIGVYCQKYLDALRDADNPYQYGKEILQH